MNKKHVANVSWKLKTEKAMGNWNTANDYGYMVMIGSEWIPEKKCKKKSIRREEGGGRDGG